MKLTNSRKTWWIETAKALRGSERRVFMARTVKELGWGGQRVAERELDWNRGTIRKGMSELESGIAIADNFGARGRKLAEVHLPNLLKDIQELVDSQSQVDPQFRSKRLYCRLSAVEVRRQLIAQKGYSDRELPGKQTINTKMNDLGYYARKVAKSQPKKKFRRPMIFLNRLTGSIAWQINRSIFSEYQWMPKLASTAALFHAVAQVVSRLKQAIMTSSQKQF